jgi:hypothetical protein
VNALPAIVTATGAAQTENPLKARDLITCAYPLPTRKGAR